MSFQKVSPTVVTPAKPAAKVPLAHANIQAAVDKATGELTLRIQTRDGKTVKFEPSSTGKTKLVCAVNLAEVLEDFADVLGFVAKGNVTLYTK